MYNDELCDFVASEVLGRYNFARNDKSIVTNMVRFYELLKASIKHFQFLKNDLIQRLSGGD